MLQQVPREILIFAWRVCRILNRAVAVRPAYWRRAFQLVCLRRFGTDMRLYCDRLQPPFHYTKTKISMCWGSGRSDRDGSMTAFSAHRLSGIGAEHVTGFSFFIKRRR
ncbi:MAG: hypothetical protein QOJ04_3916 [Caballeronia sp.]|nr:hypothetical protein [Caballeronia sp.]